MKTFALIGDYQYRDCMELNISQIRKLHPEAIIVIGDLGGNSKWDDPVIDLSGQTEREAYMMMKPLLLSILLPGKVLLMDGDTVLMQPFDIDHPVMVTTRQSRHGRINSGVVLTSSQRFVAEWLKNGIKRLAELDLNGIRANFTQKEALCEQWALIDTVDSGKFEVKEVPCDVYNYSRVEDGIPDSVKIVHLKSGRFKSQEMMKIVYEAINKNS